jgi:hypothetical protein
VRAIARFVNFHRVSFLFSGPNSPVLSTVRSTSLNPLPAWRTGEMTTWYNRMTLITLQT